MDNEAPVRKDLSDGDQDIVATHAKLDAIYVNTSTDKSVNIKDGNGVSRMLIPAGATKGNVYSGGDSKFEKGIKISPDSGATGDISVFYKKWDGKS